MRDDIARVLTDCEDIFFPFSQVELIQALRHLKLGKASDLDGISTELLGHFGPKTLSWLLSLYNSCAINLSIPKIWRNAKVVALLKPEKDSALAKSYRPVSLLCNLFKIYERLIVTRITPTCEEHLTTDQSGFRAGRACCGQVLNLTQFIEDGF